MEEQEKLVSELINLYIERDNFAKSKYISKIPESLINDIASKEEELLKYLLPELEEIGKDITTPDCIKNKITIAFEYDNNMLTRIGISTKQNAIDEFPIIKNIKPESEQEPDEEKKHTKSPSVGFTVRFKENTGDVEIHEKEANQTMIKAFEYMGLERVSKCNIIYAGCNIVGTKEHQDKSFQRRIGNWLVFTKMSNNEKKKKITQIAKLLNFNIEIIDDDNKEDNKKEELERNLFDIDNNESERSNKREKFSLNNETETFCKNRCVHHVVKTYLNYMKDLTFSDIKEAFPKELQGSYGVIASIEELKDRIFKNKTEKERWFLKENEILETSDGTKFAVCSEWGNNFTSFQDHIKNNFGWELKSVE